MKAARFVLFAVMAMILSGFAAQADAQTRKKKRAAKPKMVAVIPQSSTSAQIVSRAEDYLSDDTQNSSQIIDPAETSAQQPQTVDERLANTNKRVKDMNARIKTLEGSKPSSSEEKKKGLLLNLDILTRAEQRAESLRKQVFEMVEKESSVKTKLDQIENDIRPETIQRQVALAGTLRPEELREMKQKSLEIDKKNLQDLLIQIQATKANLETSVQRADLMVEKLRAKLEKDIDDALVDDPKNEN